MPNSLHYPLERERDLERRWNRLLRQTLAAKDRPSEYLTASSIAKRTTVVRQGERDLVQLRKGATKGSNDLQSYLGGANRVAKEVASPALATYAGTAQLPPTPKVPERSSPTIRSTGASSMPIGPNL